MTEHTSQSDRPGAGEARRPPARGGVEPPSSPRPTALPLIGAQLSTAGGFARVPERALAVGAEAVQVFSSNPRTWRAEPPDPATLAEFGAALRRLRLPLFFHTIYLINLASPDPQLRGRSSLAVAHALVTGALAGAAGVVTHIGSHRGDGFEHAAPLVQEAVQAAVAAAASDLSRLEDELAEDRKARRPREAARALPPLLLETGAGSGATVGDRLDELSALMDLLTPLGPDATGPELGLCLDTAHLFAAGYALHQAAGLGAFLAELRRRGLLDRVRLLHLNDSAAPFASNRDRHANPGAGELGYAGLARVVRHPALSGVPFVLEVPGSEGHGPGAAEVALVKTMRQGAPSPPTRPTGAGRGPEAQG
jgi:deoxyribonuclease-4